MLETTPTWNFSRANVNLTFAREKLVCAVETPTLAPNDELALLRFGDTLA